MKAFCDGGDLAEAVGKAIRAISNKSYSYRSERRHADVYGNG